MFPTMEVRWFYEGIVPGEVRAWFQQGEPQPPAEPPAEQPRRLDHYLRLGTIDSLGIKLREGRIEIKQRRDQPRPVRFHERLAGAVEQWRKWSLILAGNGGDLSSILVPARSWLPVHKERSLRRYQVAGGAGIAAVPAELLAGQGCNVELTSLQVEGQAWWSLGFEAFGEESSLWDNLLATVGHVLDLGEVPFLFEAGHSYGYPGWFKFLE